MAEIEEEFDISDIILSAVGSIDERDPTHYEANADVGLILKIVKDSRPDTEVNKLMEL